MYVNALPCFKLDEYTEALKVKHILYYKKQRNHYRPLPSLCQTNVNKFNIVVTYILLRVHSSKPTSCT